MPNGGVCPVCEIPHRPDDERAAVHTVIEPAAPTVLGRLWQSGRLAVAIAAACFALATFVPLVSVRQVHGATARMALTPLQMITAEGSYGKELKSVVLFALPGASLGLLQFLYSRRTRSVMLASRPLVLVVSVLPLVAAVLPVLKILKYQRFDYGLGPAMVLVGIGTVAGVVGAVQFGRGVSDPPPRREHEHQDVDDD